MGGQGQQSNAASAASLYNHAIGVGPVGDSGDAVMARWLQSAGLQHLASPMASTDNRFFPNVMQGYGGQSVEEKQRLFKVFKNLNFNGESGSEPYMPATHPLGGVSAIDGFYSPELRGEFGAGLLDLNAMDDTELISEHGISQPFESSPFMPGGNFDSDFDIVTARPLKGQAENSSRLSAIEKEPSAKESNIAKIKVVVRKRPLNKKEISRKEDDIVTVHDSSYLSVHEPKLKVDLTAYVEKHEFCFDAVLDENVNNDEVYRVTVEPIIPTIFQRTKATCFAYGQTGSGKTFTMQPLPLRASEDIVRLLHQPVYSNQRFRLWLSYFEIYGGKLFDLLSDRRKLCMREDGRQQVCIVGLQEFEVSDVQIVREYIEKGIISRSHAILQLVIKKHKEVNNSKRHNEGNESKGGKVIGKLSFIDLAGSERGADTTDNDRQTRRDQQESSGLERVYQGTGQRSDSHPIQGEQTNRGASDSFVGNSRTIMISCISPNAGSCEHTLNTLRYADRVKSLSRSGNPKKDQVLAPSVPVPAVKESSSPYFPSSLESQDVYEQSEQVRAVETGRRAPENAASDPELDRHSSTVTSSYSLNGREESGTTFSSLERVDPKGTFGGQFAPRLHSTQNTYDTQDEDRVSPPRRKLGKEEKSEKQSSWARKDSGSDFTMTRRKQKCEGEPNFSEEDISAILEEEEALIAAHRKEIEDTMEIVREEMKLLAEVDQPGSLIDNYVTQLNFVLSRKAAGLVSFRLAWQGSSIGSRNRRSSAARRSLAEQSPSCSLTLIWC
ncbi:unnamed protein product [Spirodela intermedia]|uniref:Kinesin-like protein n=1 Tax=Spirodela intermedia TaxID=51605 RepID=A0A7I8I9G9_SPIIN|nr:unnamed protein product [Spirodela intermedia]CAA6654289.1 unnamed protein product [Spirodela intermedia]